MDVKHIPDELKFQPDRMAKINLFESPRMFCDLYCLEPGQSQKVHSHEGNDKIYYVLDGEGTFIVGTERQVLKAGQIVCAWSGQPHGVENHSDRRLTCLVFMAPHPSPGRFE